MASPGNLVEDFHCLQISKRIPEKTPRIGGDLLTFLSNFHLQAESNEEDEGNINEIFLGGINKRRCKFLKPQKLILHSFSIPSRRRRFAVDR